MSDLRKQLFEGRKIEYGLETIEENLTHAQSKRATSGTPNKEFEEHFFKKRDELLPFQDKLHIDQTHFIQTYYLPPSLDSLPTLVCHHGAGSSALTFFAFVSELKRIYPNSYPGVFLFDMFGHGISTDRPDFDYRLDTITSDFSFILNDFVERRKPNQLLFLGHSLGGAILINYLIKYSILGSQVSGLVLLDVVEETALRSLTAIPSYLKLRPNTFRHYEDALNWHLKTRLLRNEESARLSLHDVFKDCGEGGLCWRTDLEHMSPFWKDWFTGMSDNFLHCGSSSEGHMGKLLILAGNENLDKKLIIGQMQGKYQLIVFNNFSEVGHFVQEDLPSKLCISVMEFLQRHDATSTSRKHSSIKTLWGGVVH